MIQFENLINLAQLGYIFYAQAQDFFWTFQKVRFGVHNIQFARRTFMFGKVNKYL